jgi:hypothetical protein
LVDKGGYVDGTGLGLFIGSIQLFLLIVDFIFMRTRCTRNFQMISCGVISIGNGMFWEWCSHAFVQDYSNMTIMSLILKMILFFIGGVVLFFLVSYFLNTPSKLINRAPKREE